MTGQTTDYTLEVHQDGGVTTTIRGTSYRAQKGNSCTGCAFDEETKENAAHCIRVSCTSAHDDAISDLKSVVWVRAE